MILQNLHPAAVCLLDMIIEHLPSPVIAQQYRFSELYTGPLDDAYAISMSKCDREGPLMMFISKSLEVAKKKVVFGRIFSGTARPGSKVFVMNTRSGKNKKKDDDGDTKRSKNKLQVEAIRSVNVMLAKSCLSLPFATAGMVIGLSGKIANVIPKTATVTDGKGPGQFVYPFKSLQFKVSAVISRGISVKARKHEKQLRAAIEMLTRTDPLLEFHCDQNTGQMLLTGSGEFHLVTSLEILRQIHLPPNVIVETSEPIITFRETCVSSSDKKGLAKSANNLNRIFLTLELLDEELVKDLEDGKIHPNRPGFLEYMRTKYNMSGKEVKKIMSFGPEGRNTNMLVDQTRGIPYFNEVKQSIISGFQNICNSSAICGEELRGVRINVVDGKFHSDSSHRGTGQILPCMEKVMRGMILSSGPRLVEPWYYLEIQTKSTYTGQITSVLKRRRARINDMENTMLQSLVIRTHIPVLDSLGVVDDLRQCTSGNALSTMIFSHWEVLERDRDIENEENCKSISLIEDIRKRKGFHNVELPKAENYLDRL